MADMMAMLQTIVSRLDGLDAKMANLQMGGGGDEGGDGGAELPKSIKAFDEYVRETVDPFVAAGKALGSDAELFANLTADAWTAMRSFLLLASACKEPTGAELNPLLKDVVAAMGAVDKAIKRNDWELHGKVCKEGVSVLNWLVVKPAPRDFVESSVGGCDLHANKIRIAHKGKEGGEAQIAFCATQRKVVTGLMDYIKEYHTTGVRWNKTPGALATKDYKADGAATPAAAPAAAAAPRAVVAAPKAAPAPVARPNLFAALNKGADITSGLKTVTKDQQTWRKEFSGADAPPAPVAAKPKPVPRVQAGPKGPPRLEYVPAEKRWYVENQSGPCEVVAEDIKTKVMVYGCVGATVQVTGKCTSVIVDSCKKTTVYFESVLSGCEVVNSQRINVHVTKAAPSVAIDKTDGIVVHLSEAAMETTITTSKSSEMNVSWIDKASDELVERPIPEQFVHNVDPVKQFVSAAPSDLYSH